MLVELDVFSGRPNPRWEADDVRAELLREHHRRLSPARGQAPAPPGLGYRGFHYTLDGSTWHAWGGHVVGTDALLHDPGRTVERLLLESLPVEHVGLRERIAGELGGGGVGDTLE